MEIESLQRAKRNTTVLSEATGRPATLCAVSSQKVEDNFISLRIVKRCGFKMSFDAAAVSSIIWDTKLLSSTGRFVDLLIPMLGSAKNVVQRFHVLKDCAFDMLLGTLEAKPSIC